MISIPLPYRILGVAAAFAALGSLSYCKGNTDGRSIIAAKYLKRDILLRQRMDAVREDIDKVSGAYAAAARDQSTETRVIYNESVKIVERQSAAPCLDNAAVSLLDRAQRNANRELDGEHTGATPETPSHAP